MSLRQKPVKTTQKSQIQKNLHLYEAIIETQATKFAQITFAKHKRTVEAIITIRKSTLIT